MNKNSRHTDVQAGELDADFSEDGIFHFPSTSPNPETSINNVLINATDGSIYFTGITRTSTLQWSYLIGRLTPEGVLDSTFNHVGYASGAFPPNTEAQGQSVILLEDGKILLIAGLGPFAQNQGLARFLNDGTLDKSFGDNGYISININPELSEPKQATPDSKQQATQSSVVRLDDGRILIVQSLPTPRTSAYIIVLKRDGALDLTFNKLGYVKVIHPDHDPASVKLYGGVQDKDGNITVCGYLRDSTTKMPLLAQYTADGTVNTSFGDRGFQVINPQPSVGGVFKRLIPLRGLRMLGIGRAGAAKTYKGLLSSFLNNNGSADPGFNAGKPLLSSLGNADTIWQDAAMSAADTNDRFVVAGLLHSNDCTDVAVARMTLSGDFDPAFNGVGWVHTALWFFERRS